uniref:Uncharacterized protein n=1 Tax=mine drainage metagenome TaxID=410659 RepID=E6QPE7_9ZZZZ
MVLVRPFVARKLKCLAHIGGDEPWLTLLVQDGTHGVGVKLEDGEAGHLGLSRWVAMSGYARTPQRVMARRSIGDGDQ